MKKLFVALDLPATIREDLTALQPEISSHVRLVEPKQMHVTLYFIGDAEIDPMRTALDSVVGKAFALTMQGLGQFRTAKGKTVLWAAIKESSPLNDLHDAITFALHNQGVQKETKSYTPHVTLARCSSGTPADVIDKFLNQSDLENTHEIEITTFGLYTSTIVNSQLVYTLENSYDLKNA